ncbi:MAG: hypothetical protein ABEJ04_05080 [Halobacteriaceae archaeon]
MAAPSLRAVGSRAAQGVVVAGALVLLGASTTAALAAGAAAFALLAAGDVLAAVVGPYADGALFGAVGVAVFGYVLLTDGGWPAALGALGGAWVAFDGVQHVRAGAERRRSAPSSALWDTRLTGRAYGALRDRPRSAEELAVDLDADPAAVDRALAHLQRTDRVEEAANVYRVNEDPERFALLRALPRRALARFLEPFRLAARGE